MKWTRNKLLELFPSHRGEVTRITSITGVFIDSRKKSTNGLFVPIVGERFDGHDFLLQAIEHGAIAALWQIDRSLPAEIPEGFPVFLVEDTVDGLQHMAKRYLQTITPTVIAVTGSNGKTTTKDMIACVLSKKFNTHKTAGNLNNHIGLPLTVLAMPEDCDAIILEMGMNHFGEISTLSKLTEPDFAIITNIGESHIEFLGSRKGIAKAKMEITDGLKEDGKVIYDGDEPLLAVLHQQPSVSCGFGEENDLVITSVGESEGIHRFLLNKESKRFEIPMLGKHSIKNATFAIAVAKELNVSGREIAEELQELEVTPMRFQQLQGKSGSLLINDAYNASPTSMKAAIEAVMGLEGYNRKVLVLGDMLELGNEEKAYHEQAAKEIKAPITDVITVGKRGRWIAETVNAPIHVSSFDEKEDAVPCIEELLTKDTVVLFKASRDVGLETIVEKLKG